MSNGTGERVTIHVHGVLTVCGHSGILDGDTPGAISARASMFANVEKNCARECKISDNCARNLRKSGTLGRTN
jgi:hypothetical protein